MTSFMASTRYGSSKEETFGWCSPDSWGEYCNDHSYSQNDQLPTTDKITDRICPSVTYGILLYALIRIEARNKDL